MNNAYIKKAFLPCMVAVLILLDDSTIHRSPDGSLHYQSRYTAHAYDQASIRSELVNALNSEALADRFIQDLNIPTSHEGIYREHLTKTWSNELIRNTFVEEVITILPALSQDTLPGTRELMIAYSASWFQEKASKGLLRLNNSDIRMNIRFAEGLFEYLPPEVCKATLLEEISASEVIQHEVSYMTTLPEHEVRAYLNTMRSAIIAELNDYPTLQPISSSQRQIAQAVLDERLMTALTNHPDGSEILEGFNSLNALSDQALCSLTVIMMNIAANEQGAVGNWLMRYILE